MTAQSAEITYPKLLAPKGDREMLIWPDGRQLLRDTWTNHRALREDAPGRIAGVPLTHLRRWMRRWLGHGDDARPIIATGHQTELYHPGVWMKNVIIDAAAQRIGAVAIHFSVDTDAPKHLLYRWPGGGYPITDDPDLTRARWSGRLACPSRQHVDELSRQAKQAASRWGFVPACDDFFDTLANLAGHDVGLPEAITNAHHATDRALSLRHQTLVSSHLTQTTGYLLFVHDICARAEQYVRVYNAALADFRHTHDIVSTGRPMPDLALDQASCEVPFWLDDLVDGARQRASLTRLDNKWALLANDDQFVFDANVTDAWTAAEQLGAWLARHKLRLSPRALTLTSFLRLAVVDQFVHGIGGAIYDQVTDRILQIWHGIAPPKFSVGTITMYFPAAAGRQRTALEPLAREGRRLRHQLLGDRKLQILREITAAPRQSSGRAMLFSQMHREMALAAAADPRMAAHEARLAEARNASALDSQLFDREMPYTMQSHERLTQVIDQVSVAFR